MTQLLDQFGRPVSPIRARANSAADFFASGHDFPTYHSASTKPAQVVSLYYSCLTQIARAVAQMPLKLWRQDGARRGQKPGFRQEFGHRIQPRLDRPHPQMSRIRWLEHWGAVLLDGGDAFCVPDEMPGPDGIPRALPIYGRSQVRPVRDGTDGPLVAWNFYRRPHEEPKRLPIDRVMHWALPNPFDDVMGLAPKDSLRMRLDATFFAAVFEKTFYQNSATPSAVLINKNQELDELQRAEIRQSFKEMHGGPSRAGKLLILGNDWDFKLWSLQQSQAQYADSLKYGREEIAAAFFGFPVGFLNAQENGGLSRAGEEADRLKLFENCAFPLARLFEEEFNNGFVKRIDPRLEVAFDTRGVPVALQYAKAESEVFKNYVENGVAVNDVIDMLDLPFDPQDGGDVALVSKNLMPLDQAAEMAAIDITPATQPALPSPATEQTLGPSLTRDPLDMVTRRLRWKLKRVLFEIRKLAVREPERARKGSNATMRWRWLRSILPPITLALKQGQDATTLAGFTAQDIDQVLTRLQERVEELDFGNAPLDDACEATAGRLIDFLDDTLREAAAADSPERYLASLDRAAHLLADRTVHSAVAAGAAAREAA